MDEADLLEIQAMGAPIPFPNPGPTPSQTSTALPVLMSPGPAAVPPSQAPVPGVVIPLMVVPPPLNYAPVVAATAFVEPGPGGPVLDPNPLTGRGNNG